MSSFRKTEYPIFQPQQVLTHSRLNELFQYLDGETRISRTDLIGTGIVCGLQVHTEMGGSGRARIVVKPGLGISSDGFLLKLDCLGDNDDGGIPDWRYEYYEPYVAPRDAANGSPFDYRVSTDVVQQIPLYRLVQESGTASAPIPLTSGKAVFPKPALNAEGYTVMDIPANVTADQLNWVAILFLSQDLNDEKNCFLDCDDQGAEQRLNIEVLVATTFHLDMLFTQGRLTNQQRIGESVTLPRLEMPRPDPVTLTTINSGPDLFAYFDAATNGPVDGGADMRTTLSAALTQAYNQYDRVLGLNEEEQALVNNFIASLPMLQPFGDLNSQYYYDMHRDFCSAWEEFMSVAYYLKPTCCVPYEAHERFLMLGLIDDDLMEYGYDTVDTAVQIAETYDRRHFFQHSAGYDESEKDRTRARLLFLRMVKMYEKNFFPGYILGNPLGFPLITPSRGAHYPLSERSIPFYFTLDDSQLVTYWNPDLGLRNKQNHNLSYGAQTSGYGGGLPMPAHVQMPLRYNLDKYDFFRVEGYQSWLIDDALLDLRTRISQFSLPFKVVAVRVADTDTFSPDYLGDYCGGLDQKKDYKDALAAVKCYYESVIKCLDTYDALCLLQTVNNRNSQIEFSGLLASGNPNGGGGAVPREVNEFIISRGRGSVNVVGTFNPDGTVTRSKVTEDIKPVEGPSPRYQNIDIKAILESIASLQDYLVRIVELAQSGLFTEGTVAQICDQLFAAHQQAVFLLGLQRAAMFFLVDRHMYRHNSSMYLKLSVQFANMIKCLECFLNDCSTHRLMEAMMNVANYNAFVANMSLLRNYAAEHPGIEHRAGVSRGGTLVLAYTNFDAGDFTGNYVVGDFCLPAECCKPYSCPDQAVLRNCENKAAYYYTCPGQPLRIHIGNTFGGGNTPDLTTIRTAFGSFTYDQTEGVLLYEVAEDRLQQNDVNEENVTIPIHSENGDFTLQLAIDIFPYCCDPEIYTMDLVFETDDFNRFNMDIIPRELQMQALGGRNVEVNILNVEPPAGFGVLNVITGPLGIPVVEYVPQSGFRGIIRYDYELVVDRSSVFAGTKARGYVQLMVHLAVAGPQGPAGQDGQDGVCNCPVLTANDVTLCPLSVSAPNTIGAEEFFQSMLFVPGDMTIVAVLDPVNPADGVISYVLDSIGNRVAVDFIPTGPFLQNRKTLTASVMLRQLSTGQITTAFATWRSICLARTDNSLGKLPRIDLAFLCEFLNSTYRGVKSKDAELALSLYPDMVPALDKITNIYFRLYDAGNRALVNGQEMLDDFYVAVAELDRLLLQYLPAVQNIITQLRAEGNRTSATIADSIEAALKACQNGYTDIKFQIEIIAENIYGRGK